MKVTPKESVVCNNCGRKDSFIYFAGPSGSRRVCIACKNEQVGIDIVVDLHQSDDPPEFVAKRVSNYPSADKESEMEICDECGYRGTKPCTFCDLVKGCYLDNILEQQELDDYENIEHEYFDLSSGTIPF